MMGPTAATKDVMPPHEAVASPARVDDFAIVVGIDDYPEFRSLRGAVEDATTFHRWLCDPDGGGVDPNRAWLVTSTPDPTPEQKHIDEALEALLQAADNQRGGRRLYFYFSGHGAAAKDAIENVALLLADWSKKRASLGLSSQSYTNELMSYGLFDELAVFLDCCRTKSAFVGRGITLTPTLSSQKAQTRKLVAYATESGHSAFEERWMARRGRGCSHDRCSRS